MSMYIRLKRRSQTVFLHVEPSNTFAQVKARIAEIFSIADPAHVMLVADDKKKELMDLATVSDQEIKTDDVVYMVFQKETGAGWEELQADVFTSFGQDHSEEGSGVAMSSVVSPN
ncbi:hypothetical protein B484DRAFT_364536 [Ochromonadaceae sp. CCMP2298]|nr:hypothetical protein B484DRAFT_364536 [Ochromonadaceae sp. CCMP2298]|mmetsp:Transcript_25657/g.56781  ORF Transcript_25657/g.56781 Transcript_25657/m.56781 type:complete len:115 (-) Transcript_25657:52-396(-)|eukprot:CAMPEP_0173184530 /NCGR_PEP_ID=MMETSP1141-20130122/9024_1 /TAXON_ID=483371 /ORGANISM="non described non described, Strain CCMP2298" /LENGTH=114 /DNA_ID=CAMNT_0014107905 /DNA_START=93 /DNA_END=437 /DNA_ORIENTATION=-